VSLEPSLLPAKQFQLSQSVFIREVFCLSDNLCGPPLDSLQLVHVLLALGTFCGLAPAGNKESCGHSLTPSPMVGWGGESQGKGKNSWAGIKNILTEQQREKKITRKLSMTTYRVQFSHRLMLSSLPSSKSLCSGQLPNLNTEHDIIWYRISHLIG